MALTYKKLWKLLIDRGLKKTELCTVASLSSSTVAKLSKDKNVNTEVIEKICKNLNCNVNDIVEYVEE